MVPVCGWFDKRQVRALVTAYLAVWLVVADEPACPTPWVGNGDSCYLFERDREMTSQEAAIYCLQTSSSSSSLLSVNTEAEHAFVQSWLARFDTDRNEWFTSGQSESTGSLLYWQGDGSRITADHFISPAERNRSLQSAWTNTGYYQLVYKYTDSSSQYLWAWSLQTKTLPFICELKQSEVWKMYQQQRDFSYGNDARDPRLWETGPNITFISPNTVFFLFNGATTSVVLDCQAVGNPAPEYRWFRQKTTAFNNSVEWLTSDLNPRISLTNGRLTITKPDLEADAGIYTCLASNKFGTVLSSPIEVVYGYIDQFSNVPRSDVIAQLYMGIEIVCSPPQYNTELYFTWFKSPSFNPVRPEMNPQFFMSRNGNLYISEVQASDQDSYYCAVFMGSRSDQILANNQPPSRNSLAIQLKVVGQNANTYGPDIHNTFPQVFPKVPVIGQKMEIECLAFGRLPLEYSWVRDDGPMHPQVTFRDRNRVLSIPKARLQDSGSYTCLVRGHSNVGNKTINVLLQAPPRFPLPLQNQHVDVGDRLTWVCRAIGVPPPTYTWFRNGEILRTSVAEGITVLRNVLTIETLEAHRHDGMYECEATNMHGVARSSAQIRVLSLPPTFVHDPVPSSRLATEGGNISIPCRPQASPRAQIQWHKDGAQVEHVLPNGDLQLSFLAKSDSGNYTCLAINIFGEARSTCTIQVQEKTVFTEVPSNVVVQINETTSLPCKVSFDQTKADVTYSWLFNSRLIDFNGIEAAHYVMSYPLISGMLYIISTQLRHQGEYTCMVSSVSGSMTTSAFLTVNGPPGEPYAVHLRTHTGQLMTSDNVELWWQEGQLNGYPVTKFAIEYQSILQENSGHIWTRLLDDIAPADVQLENYPKWKGFWIQENLSPGGSYRFRVLAGNSQLGYGPPSLPSTWYKLVPAAPVFAPENIVGGGGATGELHIEWDPLPDTLWGASYVHYNVHFRQQREDGKQEGIWRSVHNLTSAVFNTVVPLELFYTPFEVKVQAANEIGDGPNSSVAIVYSADAMPSFTVPKFLDIQPINGTAVTVTWEPILNTREAARGTVFAYQVNYWSEDSTCPGRFEDTALFNRFYGDVGEGVIVGLTPWVDYCANVQFLNHAGMGPKTDNYFVGMNQNPPSAYPEYVVVTSHGRESVRLRWIGVNINAGEEAIVGYKAWWWDIRLDIRAANVTDFGNTYTGVLHGIEMDIIYKVRMMAYGIGGDGKKSQDVLFSLGGLVMYDPGTADIMNFTVTSFGHFQRIVILLVCSLCWLLLV